MIVIDLNKAKEITKARLRYERAPLLQQLDIEFQQALENNNDTAAIITEKNRLRNITDIVDQVQTVDELKLIKCSRD